MVNESGKSLLGSSNYYSLFTIQGRLNTSRPVQRQTPPCLSEWLASSLSIGNRQSSIPRSVPTPNARPLPLTLDPFSFDAARPNANAALFIGVARAYALNRQSAIVNFPPRPNANRSPFLQATADGSSQPSVGSSGATLAGGFAGGADCCSRDSTIRAL